MRIGILLFDEVDLTDVAGPYEVLLTASRLQVRRRDAPTCDGAVPNGYGTTCAGSTRGTS